nr:phospholipase-like protein [Tanacetum cinerariifolium]
MYKEEFCLVNGLRFGVEYWADYNNENDHIPFRRLVFSSAKDGKPIIGKMVEKLITGELFYRLHDDDAVSLYCIGILQFVLLGLENRRGAPDWILRDENVRCWPSLYATQPKKDVDRKTYSIFEFTWAFKTWILESFRVGANDYYKRHRRYPRVVTWSSKRKFYQHMLHGFIHGRLPIEILTPDEIEARSDWWVSSGAYFDGHISEAERIPRHVNRQNHYEVPSEFYREFEEQKRVVDQMMKKDDEREKCMNKEVRPSMYRRTPYMDLPPTTVLPKKRSDKTKNKVKNANVSPLNLGNAFVDENVGGGDVMFLGEHDTGNYLVYENIDPSKVMREDYIDCMEFLLNPYDVYLDCHMMGYMVPDYFWRQLVPHLSMADSHTLEWPNQEGWLSRDHMNAWIELLIRERTQNAN